MLEHLLRKKQIPYFKRNGLFTRLEAIREALKGKKSKILQFLFNTDKITTKKLNGMLNVLPLPQNCTNYVMDCRFVELRRSVPVFCFVVFTIYITIKFAQFVSETQPNN